MLSPLITRRITLTMGALLILGLALWIHPTHFGLIPASPTVFADSQHFKPWVDRIRKSGVVPVGMVQWFYPFSYRQGKQQPLQGFSVELTQKLVTALGEEMGVPNLKLESTPINLAEAPDQPLPAIIDREVAFECNATLAEADYPKAIIPSDPFFVSSVHIMSSVQRPVRHLEEVRGKSLLGQEGVFQRWAEKRMNDDLHLDVSITPYPILQYATVLADQGQGYAIIGDALRLFNLIYAIPPEDSLKWGVGTYVGDVRYACTMLESEIELQGYLNKAIAKVLADESYQLLYFRWFIDKQPDTNITLNYPMPKALQALIQHHGGKINESLIGINIQQPSPPGISENPPPSKPPSSPAKKNRVKSS